MIDDIGIIVEKLNALVAKMSNLVENLSNGGGSLFTTTLWGAAAVVVAAIIAREMKISEFRQAWINGLRDDISDYMSKAYEWMDLYIIFNGEPSQDKKAGMVPQLERIKYESFRLLSRVEMRFKPNDGKANALVGKLSDLLDPKAFGLSASHAGSSWRKLADEAVAHSRQLLKEEWEVTKKPWRKIHALESFRKAIFFRKSPVLKPQQSDESGVGNVCKERDRKRPQTLIKYFAGTGIAASLLFFFAAALSTPFKNLILLMNNPRSSHTPLEWAIFAFTSFVFATVWSGLWLWFKGCEKRFLEFYFKKEPQPNATADAPVVAPLS